MSIGSATATTLSAVALFGAALVAAPVATATPECVNTGPRTTQCQTGGSTQIVTEPPPVTPVFPFFFGFPGFFIGI